MLRITATDYRKVVNSYLVRFGTDPNDVPSEIVWQMMGEGHGPATAARKIHAAAIEAGGE